MITSKSPKSEAEFKLLGQSVKLKNVSEKTILAVLIIVISALLFLIFLFVRYGNNTNILLLPNILESQLKKLIGNH
jgi:hypothetical protein